MSSDTPTSPDGVADAGPPEPRRSATLELVVVRYDDGPDRCTVSPRSCPDEKRTTAWLTADRSAFVVLEDAL